MARIKTTLSLDESLLRQIRIRAARSGRRDSDVMEEVVRWGLGSLERIREKAGLSDEAALKLASQVVHEIRVDETGKTKSNSVLSRPRASRSRR
jgi:plasmid stability protein